MSAEIPGIGRHDIITVLGGGWSAKDLDLDRLPGFVIGVNDAAIHARCDAAVSMDRLWAENRHKKLQELGLPTWFRAAAVKNFEPWPQLTIFECDHTESAFSNTPGYLNGTNSGACGFNLAYQAQPHRIYLVGFDMGRGPKGEVYWYQPYPWANPRGGTGNARYAEWARQWATPASQCRRAGIEVFNVNRTDTIRDFIRIDPNRLEKRAA